MAKHTSEIAFEILRYLASLPREVAQNQYMEGKEVQKKTDLSPEEINDGVAILEPSGSVVALKTLGTHPFNFAGLQITAYGRYEYERIISEHEPERGEEMKATLPPTPVGSPFGFTDLDWEFVAKNKNDGGKLRVVLGYQFDSDNYESSLLQDNIKGMFATAVDEFNNRFNTSVILDFKPLRAGYGEHLFNEIARDIISADVAVFETSDQNPNVMIELGVALTWGVRVLPIKRKGKRTPPSDISGQTWVDHEDSAASFYNENHSADLYAMVEMAVRKKGRTR